jgi:NAD(P)-dependent dehydrogenase (short-subunit alcohol dehydrogenase family)
VELQGKVALVTGAGSAGTGRAIACALGARGAAVAVNDIADDGGAETVRLIGAAGGEAGFVRADVTKEEEVQAAIDLTVKSFGGLDILVNNAGGTPRPHFPDAPVEHWSRTLDLNLRGPMLAIQHALPEMRRRGGGAVVNISSVAGIGWKQHSSPEYSAAKAGLARLTATLAPLAERDGVRVNCIVPNWVGTDDVLAEIAAMTPEERADEGVPDVLTKPEEIAELAARLIEDESLAGRVFVWWTGDPPEAVPLDALPGV